MRGAGLEIPEESGANKELKWALDYADKIDPLSSWRAEITKVKANAAGKPCPDCGKVHARDERAGADSDGGDAETPKDE